MIALASFLDPVALGIVGGGTLLGTMLRTPLADLAAALRSLRILGRSRFSADPLLRQIAAQARIARRHGAIALDRSIIVDADLRIGIAAIVDALPPVELAALLAETREARVERHVRVAEIWAGAAELAPAMGMVGTLIGLAQMFRTLADPAAIGSAMAVALLATLYGALLANLVLMPVAARLRTAARIEAFERSRLDAPLLALATREQPHRPLARVA